MSVNKKYTEAMQNINLDHLILDKHNDMLKVLEKFVGKDFKPQPKIPSLSALPIDGSFTTEKQVSFFENR